MPDPTNPPETVDEIRAELVGNWMLIPLDVANHLTAPVVAPAKVIDALVEAARQEGEQLAQAWADLVQLYGDQLMIDQATTMGLWPEQLAVPVPEEETEENDA